ncbi:carbohydrate ABC transporter permease [Paenibacillus aurantius]|uniref:Carbohydrate ABC transporter permease n=1 Tax=Paenibacillus aurantius TaxID=2918900 RepID=A0AA96LAK0_9BACL|nr:carbohydrate ABC transporter permease [Paenibacillus aurantius]WNQ10209.1 carbohydrate ABC transporter permease [Paenibacillus aurantius]
METSLLSRSKGDRVFDAVNYTFLTLVLLASLYPLVNIISSSFSSSDAVIAGRVWLLPVDPTLEGYAAVFKNKEIWRGFSNSLFYMIVGTVINVIITLMAAYPLSRPDFYGRNPLMFLFVFTMMFSGGLIPTYLVVRDLGLLDSRWAMILPGALSIWNMIITRTYFQTTIPQELLEAAQMDGSDDFTFVRKVVLPVSGPIIAVISLFYAVGHWNSFFNALLYLKSEDLFPLQLVLRKILIQNEISGEMIDAEQAAALVGLRDLLKYSLIVVAITPMLVVYPFVQKYFVKGMMIGSLKG